MSAPFCTINWPGVPAFDSFSFPFTPGIRPSTCTVNVFAQQCDPAAIGTLRLAWHSPNGGATGIDFPDCVIEQPPVSSDANGTRARLPIKDRRHWWQFGHVSGSYNVKQEDGTYQREKTPAELATLLLDAMGESGYNVSALPAAPRPAVAWNYANPASELDRLCQSFGCIVVLNPLTNKVEIWAEGAGNVPPDLPTLGRSVGYSLLAAPGSVMIVGKPTVFESTFWLYAVGEETDGSIKPIDELSYTPAGGWEKLIFMGSIEGEYQRDGQTLQTSELANASVWKMWRIGGLLGGEDVWSPEALKGTDLEPRSFGDIQILTHRIGGGLDPEGVSRQEPARCYVQSWEGGLEPDNNERLKVATSGFTIDAERGLVIFSEPQVQVVDGQWKAAKVWLRTGFHAGRDGALHHYVRERKIPGGNADAGGRIERRDLVREVVEQWAVDLEDIDGGQRGEIRDNQEDIDADADAQLDALLKAYELQASPTFTYPGLVRVVPNGRIQQVTWQSGASGTTTTASAGSRHNPYIPTLEDQRRDRDARELADMLQAGQIGVKQ